MPADFNYYLNRQGVRGKKGDKGDKGFSPNISIGDNTQESFTLVVQNEFDTFETPNLKEGLVPEDRNGTYVRLDRETGQQYYGEPDIATESTLGVIKLASQDEVNAGEEETKAVTPSTLASRIAPIETNVADLGTRTSTLETEMTAAESNITALQAQMSTAESDIDTLQAQVATNTNDITSLKGSTSTLESDVTEINANITTIEGNISTLETQIPTVATTTTAGTVKPDGTTITIAPDGTITAVGGGGGGAGDVTAAGNNVFTGSNTFQQPITLQASSSGQMINFTDQYGTFLGMLKEGSSEGLQFMTMSTSEPFLLSTVNNNQNVYFLNQASVHNGNGITITTTNTTDITIAAEVNQQDVDELGNELSALSSTVTSLESTVSTLETTMPSIATTAKAGTVKPDGTTITITDDGTISAVGGGGGSTPENMVTTDTAQNITGMKDFLNGLTISKGGSFPKTITNVSNVNDSAIQFNGCELWCGNSGSSHNSIRIYTNNVAYARIVATSSDITLNPNYVSQAGIRVTVSDAGFVNSSGEYQQFATSADLTNLGAFKYVVITAEDYASLGTKDPDTLYRVTTDGATTAVYMGEFLTAASSSTSWQGSQYTIASAVPFTATATPHEFDLSTYLPADENIYMLYLTGLVITGSAMSSQAALSVYSSIVPEGTCYIASAVTRVEGFTDIDRGTVCIPIGTDRKLYVADGTFQSGSFTLVAGLYRIA